MQSYSGNEYTGRAAAKDEKASAVSQTPIKVPMVPQELLKDLENTIQGMNLKDAPTNKIIDHATKLVQAYMYRHEAEFKRVMVYRDRGWHQNKEQGDMHFKVQRELADNTDSEKEVKFYGMMINIGLDMNTATAALSPYVPGGRNMKVFDVCMAPGGYSAAVLKLHPNAEIYGLTLSENNGGHSVLLGSNYLRGIKYADVTMLAADMLKGTGRTIPKDHPEHSKFSPLRPFVSHKFDLVLLDGIVLRTHERATYRQELEPLRLSTAQLVLGMQRVIQGGTIVMLMHKVDTWASVAVIYAFSRFANIQLFKPTPQHATRSSFYLVARFIDVKSPFAAAAISDWKQQWYAATFGGPEGTGEKVEPEEVFVLTVLEKFGEKLIEMGVPIWKLQADALSKTSYAGDADGASSAAGKEN